jgi:uracil-DNA glycosylase
MIVAGSRAAAQRLKDLQTAGVTHLVRTPATTSPSEAVPEPSPPVSAVAEPKAASLFGAGATRPVPSTRAEKETQLTVLSGAVAACRRCAELAETRTQTVFGVGNPEARIVFIGEAPGADEDAKGEPFVGRAGQLLNQIITACKLKREEIYICNILKCRPPGNRTPLPPECANCREYLDEQLRIIDPDYIVCWGSVAAQNLLGSTESIGKMRGRFFSHGRAKVVCTYHPSYLLRNPAAKKDVWQDMIAFRAEMGVDLKVKE